MEEILKQLNILYNRRIELNKASIDAVHSITKTQISDEINKVNYDIAVLEHELDSRSIITS